MRCVVFVHVAWRNRLRFRASGSVLNWRTTSRRERLRSLCQCSFTSRLLTAPRRNHGCSRCSRSSLQTVSPRRNDVRSWVIPLSHANITCDCVRVIFFWSCVHYYYVMAFIVYFVHAMHYSFKSLQFDFERAHWLDIYRIELLTRRQVDATVSTLSP